MSNLLTAGFPVLFERLMEEANQNEFPSTEEAWSSHFPRVQVLENEKEVLIRAVIPGAAMSSVALTFVSEKLVIRGTLPAPEGKPLRRERHTGPFHREVPIPCPVLGETAKAVMRNGVLTVSLPKEPRVRKRLIPVAGHRKAEP